MFGPKKSFYEHFHYSTNRIIFKTKWQEVCDKKKCVWGGKPPRFPFVLTFLLLSCLSVCLCVSRVRLPYHYNNQQHGIPCLTKRGPLPDWQVWTRELMISGDAVEREDSSGEGDEGQTSPVKLYDTQSSPVKPFDTQLSPDQRAQALIPLGDGKQALHLALSSISLPDQGAQASMPLFVSMRCL